MKRFYRRVEVGETAGEWRVLLDGRPLRTPMKALLTIGSPALAALVAAEWDAQTESILAHTMPVTKLATTVVDLMPARRRPAEDEITDFAATDALCYRQAEPAALAERQERLWQPWLNWSATALDAPLVATTGIAPVQQPATSLTAIGQHVEALDHWRLVGVHAVTKLTGSAILALAMNQAALGHAQAHGLALLEDLYTAEIWGLEEEQARRHQTLARDLAAAERFLRAL